MSWRRLLQRRAIETTVVGVAAVLALVVLLSPSMAAPSVQYLHAADVLVGSTTYNTMTGSIGTPGTNATAPMSKNNWTTFTEGGVSILVSNPVPAGEQWAIGGGWSFTAWISNTARNNVGAQVRATIYKIAAGGTSTTLATTAASNITMNLAFGSFTWAHTLAANTLVAGERFGVQFQLMELDGRSGSANLRLDDAAAASSVTAQVAVTTVPGAPQTVAATAGNGQATVTWAAPASDGGSAITGYTVTPSPAHVAPVTVNGSTFTATLTGLTNGTSYTFTVVATNALGNGPGATSNAVTPAATVPGAPTSVVATAGNAQATVTWSAPSSNGGSTITSYTVTSNPGGLTATTPDGVTLTATVTGLTNGTAYTFTVVATNVVGNSAPSSPSNSATPTANVPGAPQNVAATAGNAQATVTWAAPASNGGSAITGYTVTPSPAHVAPMTVNGSTFTATLTGLTNGTSYTFTVVATNAIGNGPGTTSNAVTPTAGATVPGAPTNAAATAGNAQATVTWSAPASNGGSAITSYTVTSSPGGLTATTPDGVTLTATVTGLTNGTAYTFTVVATNTVGNSAPSSPSNSVTPAAPATVPGAPTNVAATAGNAQATVTWSAPASDGGSAITGYTVSPNPVGVTPVTVNGSTFTATLTGLTNGTSYTFTVVATNAVGNSAPSLPSNSVNPSAAVPGAPQSVAATAGNAQATVTWAAPASDGGSAITGYTVTPSPAHVAPVTVNGSTFTATITALSNGTSYTFTVVATNAIGNGPGATSNAVTPTDATAPGAPQNVSATAGNAQATVTWAAPLSNGNSPITSYTVTSSPADATPATVSPSTFSVTMTGLTNGTAYTFTVVATNAIGSGPGATSAAVTPLTVPGAPTAVTAVPGDRQATLTWTAPSNGGGQITQYTVTPNPVAPGATGLVVSGTPAATTTIVRGLTNGTAYTFTVTATNVGGTGPASAASNSVTPTNDRFLHAADVTVGTTPYNTLNSLQGTGPLATVSSALTRDVDTVFNDAASIAIFASDAVPSGTTWDVAGTWTYRAYVRTSSAIRINLRARLYKVSSGGVATLLSQSTLTPQVDATTNYQLVTWTHVVPTTLLNSGERFGVDFMARSIENTSGHIAYIGFDTATEPSLVQPVITENSAPGRVRQGYYRFGKDRPLAAMEWMGGVDSPATNVAKNQAMRYRILAYNDGATATNWQPNLEWSTSATTGWAAVPTVQDTSPFFVYDTTHYTNGTTIPPAQFGLENAIGTAVDGIAYDTVNLGGSLTLPGNSYTEVEFSIWVTSTPTDGTTYYLRLTNNATPLATYDAGTASVTIAYPWPTPPTRTPPAHNLHQQYSADTAACAACHRVHTSPAPTVLYKAWPEENVCFTCHDGSAAPDIQTPFSRAYKMPITSTAGVHSKDEPRLKNSANFSGANRHVECADCHNPHLAGAGNHTVGTNYAAGPQQGVWGVGVSNVTPWAAPTYAPVTEVTMQYQLCFKCHSSWAYGTSPPTTPSGGFAQTNQAKEFNTLNNAYHPVEDVGKNPFTTGGGTSYAASLIGGFTPTSRMVCTDCHMSDQSGDRAGPHGSGSPFILRGAWNRTTGNAGTQNHLCFNCHAWTTYGPGGTGLTGFSDAGMNLHGRMVGALNKANGNAPIVCMDCHVAIPHGYNRDHLLGFTGDGAPYIDRPYVGGLVVIDQWRASGQWTFSSCSTAMNSCK